jgi:flagellar hook-associated protein 1 FlgK
MGINDILYTARSGMMVSQTGLRVTGHNITNANTPGYSRQRVDVESSGGVNMMPGLGANVASVHRVHGEFLERQSNMQRGISGFLEGRNQVASQLESVFMELDDTGINRALNDFFNSFRELSNNPSGMSERRMVIYNAQTLTDRINTTARNLENLQSNLNDTVRGDIGKANELLLKLAGLNEKLASFSDPSGTNESSDLLDRRDQVVRDLHNLIGGQSFTDANGSINFMLANVTLVEGSHAGSLDVVPGLVDGVSLTTVAGNTKDITAFLQQEGGSGQLAGLIYERDVEIKRFRDQLDTLAFSLASEINAIHQASFGLDGTAGRDFFSFPGVVDGAAKALTVSQDLVNHPDWIAGAQDPASTAGDNRSFIAIADLQDDETTLNGYSFNQFYNDLVNNASTEMKHITTEKSYQDAVLQQSDAFRESISGVSVDEEMVSLIQYQRAFEASAKMISTVDQMLQTIIALKQ